MSCRLVSLDAIVLLVADLPIACRSSIGRRVAGTIGRTWRPICRSRLWWKVVRERERPLLIVVGSIPWSQPIRVVICRACCSSWRLGRMLGWIWSCLGRAVDSTGSGERICPLYSHLGNGRLLMRLFTRRCDLDLLVSGLDALRQALNNDLVRDVAKVQKLLVRLARSAKRQDDLVLGWITVGRIVGGCSCRGVSRLNHFKGLRLFLPHLVRQSGPARPLFILL